jgi:hypothetical protein
MNGSLFHHPEILTLQSSNAKLLELLESPAPDGITTEAIPVEFLNESKTDVTLCWIHNGSETKDLWHHYLFQAGSTHTESSFNGHWFVAYNPTDVKCKTVFELFQENSEFSPVFLVRLPWSLEPMQKCVVKLKGETCSLEIVPQDIVDNRMKEYDPVEIIFGFKIRMQVGLRDVVDEFFFQALREDLEHISCSSVVEIPPPILSRLQERVTIWINIHTFYGSLTKPQKRIGLCFHPEVSWLESNLMSTEKHGSIEIYDCENYIQDRELWGIGGLILHEFSHAYHYHFCPEGFNNASIKTAYEHAASNHLYDEIEYHGLAKSRLKARAYAITNEMEYFAELSVAFLHSPDQACSSSSCSEFNKWYPFNRSQLRVHDPEAYKCLKQLWWDSEDQDTKSSEQV